MAQKRLNINEELKKIEQEERAIYGEEKQVEQKEDLLRIFEELGLMRWKSYYVLTAGAILLLALTFVTSLWVMHDQITTLQDQVTIMSNSISQNLDALDSQVSDLSDKVDSLSAEQANAPILNKTVLD